MNKVDKLREEMLSVKRVILYERLIEKILSHESVLIFELNRVNTKQMEQMFTIINMDKPAGRA